MKDLRIVYTEDYALAISDDSIVDVRPHIGKYHLEKEYIINRFPDYLTDLWECSLIIAHLPLTEHASQLENVPLLPPLHADKSIEQMAVDYAGDRKRGSGHGYPSYTARLLEKGFIEGYKAASNGGYTEEEFNGFLDGFTDDAPISYIRSEFRKYVENKRLQLKPSVFRADTRDEAFRTTDDVNDPNAFYYVPKMKVNSNGILCGSYQ